MDQYLLQHLHHIGGLPEKNWETLKKCIMYHRSGREVHWKNKEETIIDTPMPLVTTKRNAYCYSGQERV